MTSTVTMDRVSFCPCVCVCVSVCLYIGCVVLLCLLCFFFTLLASFFIKTCTCNAVCRVMGFLCIYMYMYEMSCLGSHVHVYIMWLAVLLCLQM